MPTNTLPRPTSPAAAMTLGGFLRDRRARLSPEPDGRGLSRRRTPGLRREEVATRAGVSVTWYTWLEQGRGGAPSDEVLERLARALELDAVGREVLFLLGQQRPPPLSLPRKAPAAVPASLQRVLDCMVACPAVIKTATWDIVAWNAAAAAVFGDYAALPDGERNTLRILFREDHRPRSPEWEANARFALAVFRTDDARAGGRPEAVALVSELQAKSADFRRLWAEQDVRSHWVGQKRISHPVAGPLGLETSAFAVDGGDGLSMVVFTPASAADALAIEGLMTRLEQAA